MLAGVKSVVRFNLYWLEFVIKLTLQLYSLHLINLRQVQKIRSFTLNQGAIIRKHYPLNLWDISQMRKLCYNIQEMLEHEIGVDHEQ